MKRPTIYLVNTTGWHPFYVMA